MFFSEFYSTVPFLCFHYCRLLLNHSHFNQFVAVFYTCTPCTLLPLQAPEFLREKTAKYCTVDAAVGRTPNQIEANVQFLHTNVSGHANIAYLLLLWASCRDRKMTYTEQ
jgi:hypothetical protein